MSIKEHVGLPLPENGCEGFCVFCVQLNKITVKVEVFCVAAMATFFWGCLPGAVKGAPVEAPANIINRDDANNSIFKQSAHSIFVPEHIICKPNTCIYAFGFAGMDAVVYEDDSFPGFFDRSGIEIMIFRHHKQVERFAGIGNPVAQQLCLRVIICQGFISSDCFVVGNGFVLVVIEVDQGFAISLDFVFTSRECNNR